MNSSPDLIERVRAELRDVPAVLERRMFGSTGFLIREKLAIGARSDRLMCRIDPELLPDVLKKTGCRPVVMKGRPMKGYVYVDAAALGTPNALRYWVDLVLAHNEAIAG